MRDNAGVPVSCGGLIGHDMQEAFLAGTQCYSPVLADGCCNYGNSGCCIYYFTEASVSIYKPCLPDWLPTTYTMLMERVGAFAVQLDDKRFWVIGKSKEVAMRCTLRHYNVTLFQVAMSSMQRLNCLGWTLKPCCLPLNLALSCRSQWTVPVLLTLATTGWPLQEDIHLRMERGV